MGECLQKKVAVCAPPPFLQAPGAPSCPRTQPRTPWVTASQRKGQARHSRVGLQNQGATRQGQDLCWAGA